MAERRDGLRLRSIASLLRPYAAGERRALAAGALLSVGGVALHVVRPWPLKWLLDVLTGHGPQSAVVTSAREAGTLGFAALGGLYIVLSLGYAGARYAQTLILSGSGNRILYRFRSALFARVLGKPLSFHDAHEPGELLTRVVYDTSRLRRGVNGLLLQVFPTLLLFVATLAVLLVVAPMLAAVVAAGGVLALVVMRRLGRRIVTATRRQRRKEGTVAAQAADDLLSVRDAQTFGRATTAATGRFATKNATSLTGEQRVRRLAAALSAQVEMVFAMTVAVTLAVGGNAVAGGTLSAGDLVLFISYALALREPFAQCALETARMGRTAGCADRLIRLVAATEGESAVGPRWDAGALRGAVSLDGVHVLAPKRVRNSRKWSLDDVTLDVPAGRRVAVVGGTGAGKSTLLRLLLGLVGPARGRMSVDGVDWRGVDPAALRTRTSVVFQDAVLFGLTVRENLTLGGAHIDDAAVRAAARAALVDKFIARLPLGYDTPVRQRGTLFSAGERQRLAIARALLRDGRIWLLDEPVAGLDAETARALTEVLLEHTRDRTTFWITRDPDVIERMDRVLALKGGRVAFSGTAMEYANWSPPSARARSAAAAFTQEI